LLEEEAAQAYDEAARRLRGKLAHGFRPTAMPGCAPQTWRLNFPTCREVAAAARLMGQPRGARPP